MEHHGNDVCGGSCVDARRISGTIPTVEILTQWRRPVASRVAIPAILGDALGTVPPDPHGHHNGSQSRSIFFCRRFYVLHNRSTALLWSIKNKAELQYCSLLCININLVRIL